MGLLPAEIPEVPEARAEIVPARLARKLAPLFGVPWPSGPFGNRTWVGDYNKITLSEIARGAPLPSRGAAPLARASIVGDWAIVDRMAVTAAGHSLPNEMANATLNRFGPDTKAAVVLTGTNRLLDPVCAAVRTALDRLIGAEGSPLPQRLRVAAWAGLLLEAFRSQPALVAAAIRARTIQRELLVEWHLPRGATTFDLTLTRCEVSGDTREDRLSTSRPRDLELADITLGGFDVAVHDEIVDRFLRLLIAVGTRQSSSHLWLSERRPGQLVVEALVPPTELLSHFTDQVEHLVHEDAPSSTLPRIPTPDELDGLPLLARRAVIIALLTVLRQVQFDGELRERTRRPVVSMLDAVSALAVANLGPDDPTTVLACCRAADMTVHTLRHDTRHDLAEPVGELMAQVERCIRLARAGEIDRGAAAEAISSANVEINIVRRTNAQRPEANLAPPAELDGWLRSTWAAFLEAVEIDIRPHAQAAADPRLPAGHHLHNYAAFLATHVDDEADLLVAVELFENVVIPAREHYWRRTHTFLPLRQSLQTASRATSTLARINAASGHVAKAREWAVRGRTWIQRALAERETTRMLSQATEPAAHFCLLAVPALLVAVETGVAGTGPADIAQARDLLAVAEGWVGRVTAGVVESYSRYEELLELRSRLGRLDPVGRAANDGPPGDSQATLLLSGENAARLLPALDDRTH